MKPTNRPKQAQVTGLAKQLGKRHAFDLVEEELYLSLVRTVDRLSHGYADLFQQFGLSSPLYNALRIVAGQCKSDSNGVSVGAISTMMVCRNPDTTRLVDRLVSLGFVKCVTCPKDARRRLVKVTELGLTVLGKLHRPVRNLHRRHFRTLDQQVQKQLIAWLERVLDDTAVEAVNAEL